MFDYEYPPVGGGGGVVNASVAEELAKRHEVWVLTSQYEHLPRFEVRRGVNVKRVPVWARNQQSTASLRSMVTFPPSAWIAGARLMYAVHFDIVNAHFAVPTGPGSLPLARWAGIPHIISLHGGDVYNPASRFSPHRIPLVRATVTSVLRHSDVVVAQSNNTRENVYRYYRYQGPVKVIPLGITVPKVANSTREDIGLPKDAFIAVTVGRLIPRKATHRLIEAIARDALSGVTLVVVGQGPERASLEERSAKLGLSDRVLFQGSVTEERKWQILRSADLYVSASQHEGFGLAFLEAMACGLPVVCPDHGGQVDFLEDGKSGFLVPVDDEGALLTAISEVQRGQALAKRIRAHNMEKSRDFNAQRCATRYESLFERVLNGWRPSASRHEGPPEHTVA
jgi:glycosyltransferase involved in cell wall biosynthesis